MAPLHLFSTGSNVLYRRKQKKKNNKKKKERMREKTFPSAASASLLCKECVNPQTERGKIGHFHIYSSVRSRAVCGEKGKREEGRKEGRNHRNSGVSQAFLPLFSICEHTQKVRHTHTHTLNSLHGHTGRARQTEEEKKVSRR